VTTDHSGEAAVPFFALLTTQAGAETLGVESSRQDPKLTTLLRRKKPPRTGRDIGSERSVPDSNTFAQSETGRSP